MAKLKNELTRRGKSYSSSKDKKKDLQDKLREALDEEMPVLTASEQNKKGLECFPPTAKWRVLVPEEEPVAEPENPGFSIRAPTIPEEDAATVPTKHNYSERFDRPEFTGKMKVEGKGKQ